MEGTLDPFDYELAAILRCTVETMRATISNQEYLQWRAKFVYDNARLELARATQR